MKPKTFFSREPVVRRVYRNGSETFWNRASWEGFTLLELLVVVAVTGLLVVLAMPILSRIKHSSKEIKSLGQMKQILNAAAIYSAEYNSPIFYRRIFPDGRNMYFFQYFPTEYWDNSFATLYSPFEVGGVENKPGPRYPLLPSNKKVPLPSYGYNRNGPRVLYPNTAGGSQYIRPDIDNMKRPSLRAYFIETMGKTGAADSASDDVSNPLRYAFQGNQAALVGFMDYSVRLVRKSDLQGDEDSDWDDEDRNYFWTGNPTLGNPTR